MGNTQSEENSDNSHDKDKNNNNGDEEEYEKMCNEYDRKTSSTQIYAKEAMKLHEEGKLVIIDTREVYEHEYAAIPNAKVLSPTTLGMTLVSTVGTGMRYQQNIPLEELNKEHYGTFRACAERLFTLNTLLDFVYANRDNPIREDLIKIIQDKGGKKNY